MDKITIVIPVYNAESTLRKCVESLVRSNRKETIEIILIDDQSKDESWALCLELQHEYAQIRAIQNARNSGPSFTRNRGLDEATGNLLLFVDSDDWVSNDYISSLYDQFKEYEDSLVLCGFQFIIEKTGQSKDYLYSNKEEITVLDCADRYFRLLDIILIQQLWNKIFDLQIIRNNRLRFDEEQFIGEDTQFVLDYLRASNPKQCVIINQPLYYYLRTEQSLMGSNSRIDLTSGEKRLNDLLEISGENDPIVREAYQKAVDNNKSSLIYTIMHSDFSHDEKINFIKKVYPGENANHIYHAYNKMVYKEKVSSELQKVKRFRNRFKKH